MCTVLLRFTPGGRWPLLLAAVRDEFVDRLADSPAHHWPGRAADLIGGRDRTSGGTWLAVSPGNSAHGGPGGGAGPAVGALLNGVRLAPPADGVRPTRGNLPLAALTGQPLPDPSRYDGFHLLLADPHQVRVWTWDGVAVQQRKLEPGHHVIVNGGIEAADDPLVPHVLPLLRATADPDPRPELSPEQAWGDWLRLLAGGGLDPADPRALIVRTEIAGRAYGSTSACLVALAPDRVRYDHTPNPGPHALWREVRVH